MGSMNFGLYRCSNDQGFKFRLGRPYLEGSDDRISRTRSRHPSSTLGRQRHALRTIECYDIGPSLHAAHLRIAELEATFFIQSVFGILGGIGRIGDAR